MPDDTSVPTKRTAPEKSDLHATPAGDRPEAWKNLPPPMIVRSAPAEESSESGFRKFVRTPAAKQLVAAVVCVAAIAAGWYFIQPKYTLKTHGGTVTLFARALERRDFGDMRQTTIGQATAACEALLQQIESMENAHEASRFARAVPGYGGVPSGAQAASAKVTCRGENGDAFLEIAMNVHRQSDGTWRIAEMDFNALQ
jgi:hypothetical protein